MATDQDYIKEKREERKGSIRSASVEFHAGTGIEKAAAAMYHMLCEGFARVNGDFNGVTITMESNGK